MVPLQHPIVARGTLCDDAHGMHAARGTT
jgi:hypothetical protein